MQSLVLIYLILKQASIVCLILPVILLVGGECAFGLAGMGAPAINLHCIPFILNVADWQARNIILIEDFFHLRNRVQRACQFRLSRSCWHWCVPDSIDLKMIEFDVIHWKLVYQTIYLVFAVESIGVDGVRRKWAQHLGLARNFLCGRHREIMAQHSVETNWLQSTLA